MNIPRHFDTEYVVLSIVKQFLPSGNEGKNRRRRRRLRDTRRWIAEIDIHVHVATLVVIIIPGDDYRRNHGCANYPDYDGSFPYGRHSPKQYLVISIKRLVHRS